MGLSPSQCKPFSIYPKFLTFKYGAPRTKNEIRNNPTYQHKKYLAILHIINCNSDLTCHFYNVDDNKSEKLKMLNFETDYEYRDYMMKGVSNSMVETFKQNLQKSVNQSFDAAKFKADDSYHNQNTGSGNEDQLQGQNVRQSFKLGEKKLRTIQNMYQAKEGNKKVEVDQLTTSDVHQALISSKTINILPYTADSEL